MTPEQRAVAFLLLLLGLSVAARFLDRPRVEFPESDALDLAAHEAAVREAVAAGLRRPLSAGETIDPNTAPARELERLPRVGPTLAARIVEARETAPFATAEDLQRVPGIGPSLAGALAPYLALPAKPPPGYRAAGDASPALSATSSPAYSQRTPPGSTVPTRGAPLVPAAPLSINRATAGELVQLPGVGPVLAARIVAFRDTAGPFLGEADLERVPGIGPALRQRLAPLVRFSP
jgi:competence ComEA-like helix-hairpin-helix protein